MEAVPVDALLSINLKSIWGAARQQPKSFWFACGYLFFEYVRPQSLYPVLDILPWPVLFLALTFVFAEQERQKRLDSGGMSTGLIIMSCVVLLSSVAASNPALSFSNWRKFFDWIIIYFVVRRAVNTEVKLFLFIAVFFLANFKMTQHGFISWASRGFTFATWGVTGGPGWFHNSGEFGIELCIFVPMLLGVAVSLRHLWSRTLQLVIGLVILTGISSAIASSSRGALVGLVGAGVWMAMRSKYFIKAAIIIAAIAGIAYINIPDKFMMRINKSGSDVTSLHRLERWQHGWQAIKDNPVLGVGMKNWEPYYEKHFTPKIAGSKMVHNIFVECGTELGFLGLAGFSWLIWTTFRVTRKVRQLANGHDAPFLTGLSYGLDASTVGLLISSSFVTVFYYPFFWIQCLLVSCLYAATIDRFPPTPATKPQRRSAMIKTPQNQQASGPVSSMNRQ